MSSRRWFSRVGRRGGQRQKEPESLVTAEVRNVRDRRQQPQPSVGDGDDVDNDGQRPGNTALLSAALLSESSSPVDKDRKPAVVEEEEEEVVVQEPPPRTRPPPSLFGSTEGTTNHDHFARDALAPSRGEQQERDRYPPPMEYNRGPFMGPSSPMYNDHHAPPNRGPLMGPPPSYSSYDSYNAPGSYNTPGYPSPGARESSSLHDMASAKMAAYHGRGGGDPEAVMIPIAPGVTAKLRGANETLECIERDFYLPVVCFACSLEMCCIQDADYVICPVCRVVSPLDNGMHSDSPHVASDFRGQRDPTVGLGFTFEDLCKWQAEILNNRAGPTV